MADTKTTSLTELTAPIGTDVMPIVDDPGGSPETKKVTVTNLAGAIHGVASVSVQTTTSTGTQNDFSVTAARHILLWCNNASLLTITGISAGSDGDILDVVSIGAGQVEFDHEAAGSTAANRLINFATVGNTPLAAGSGTARFLYHGTTARWRLVAHDQGAWISPSFSAGDYTPDTGTWTVAAGDVDTYAYWLHGRTLTVAIYLSTTTVASSPTWLQVAIPAGFTATKAMGQLVAAEDGTTKTPALAEVTAGGTIIRHRIYPAATWAATTDDTYLYSTVSFEVD